MDFSSSLWPHSPLCAGPGKWRPMPSWSWPCWGHWLLSLSCGFVQDILSPAGQSQLLLTEPQEKAWMAGQDLTSPTVLTGRGIISLINCRMGYWTVCVQWPGYVPGPAWSLFSWSLMEDASLDLPWPQPWRRSRKHFCFSYPISLAGVPPHLFWPLFLMKRKSN